MNIKFWNFNVPYKNLICFKNLQKLSYWKHLISESFFLDTLYTFISLKKRSRLMDASFNTIVSYRNCFHRVAIRKLAIRVTTEKHLLAQLHPTTRRLRLQKRLLRISITSNYHYIEHSFTRRNTNRALTRSAPAARHLSKATGKCHLSSCYCLFVAILEWTQSVRTAPVSRIQHCWI